MAKPNVSTPMPNQSGPSAEKFTNSSKSDIMSDSIFPEVQPEAEQSATAPTKYSKTPAKQIRQDCEEFCAKFLAPIKIDKEDKHQLGVSGRTFDRLYDYIRVFGKRGDSVGCLAEHILIAFLDENEEKFEAWVRNWISMRGK